MFEVLAWTKKVAFFCLVLFEEINRFGNPSRKNRDGKVLEAQGSIQHMNQQLGANSQTS